MPFRLQLDKGDRTVRLPLTEGEWVVGSASDADIRISHPTVSRRHAVLRVSSDGVEVEDLGSSNGTRLGDELVRGSVAVPPGVTLLFGTAVTCLESLAEEDAEVGIALSETVPSDRQTAEDKAHGSTTVAPSVLERFAFVGLPELVERLRRDRSAVEAAQAVGACLFQSLPCTSVEVLRRPQGIEAVLFRAQRSGRGSSDEAAVVEVDEGGVAVRIRFPAPRLAKALEPLARLGVQLAGLGAVDTGDGPTTVRSALKVPPLPDPPTVVPTVRRLYSDAARVATGMVSVLIRGESGTGKEVLARFIHSASPRADGPLVTLNCAALPRDLLEAELFGVEKGVATGVESRPGRFEQANDGTLFLDEIGDMALETQARILRVLQEGEVYRIGGREPRPAKVRVISATNRDLEAMLSDGRFRTDLYHRIADWIVELPPLRRRREDIPNLAAFFLARACRERGVAAAGISRAALDALAAYGWPGNIRQLEKEMSRAALFLENGDLLDTRLLQPAIMDVAGEAQGYNLKSILERAEREALQAAVGACRGDTAAAAVRLGIGRSTLYRRLAALGIEIKE